jgi:hypothetical protein
MVEQRLLVRPGRYRVPDLLALPLNYYSSPKVVTVAPLLCIEILSPEDRMPRVLERCCEYNAMGVAETWIFDPRTKQVYIARDMAVTQFTDDMLRCGKIQISCSALFSRLPEAYLPRPATAAGFTASIGVGPAAVSASADTLPKPSALRSSVSIRVRKSGLSFKNWRAFSRPCPIRSPL